MLKPEEITELTFEELAEEYERNHAVYLALKEEHEKLWMLFDRETELRAKYETQANRQSLYAAEYGFQKIRGDEDCPILWVNTLTEQPIEHGQRAQLMDMIKGVNPHIKLMIFTTGVSHIRDLSREDLLKLGLSYSVPVEAEQVSKCQLAELDKVKEKEPTKSKEEVLEWCKKINQM